ncbi:hypothetical protein KM043_015827 [Ampulex compressa]|nr:hypothetical protein KM043_015827 [Ampulex compressa]
MSCHTRITGRRVHLVGALFVWCSSRSCARGKRGHAERSLIFAILLECRAKQLGKGEDVQKEPRAILIGLPPRPSMKEHCARVPLHLIPRAVVSIGARSDADMRIKQRARPERASGERKDYLASVPPGGTMDPDKRCTCSNGVRGKLGK